MIPPSGLPNQVLLLFTEASKENLGQSSTFLMVLRSAGGFEPIVTCLYLSRSWGVVDEVEKT